jgi:hypothetical protein
VERNLDRSYFYNYQAAFLNVNINILDNWKKVNIFLTFIIASDRIKNDK